MDDQKYQAIKWTNWRKSNYRFFERELAELAEGARLLDVGAGPQQFKGLTKKFCVTATDHEQYEGINLVTDLNKPLPIADNYYEGVMISNTLEHIQKPQELLAECHRVLKPYGKIMITVPFMMKVHQRPDDYFRYTDIQLKKMLANVGFERGHVESLGTVYDTYHETSRQFWNMVLDDAGQNQLQYIVTRAFNQMNKVILKKIASYKLGNYSHEDFTLGYGCVQYKS